MQQGRPQGIFPDLFGRWCLQGRRSCNRLRNTPHQRSRRTRPCNQALRRGLCNNCRPRVHPPSMPKDHELLIGGQGMRWKRVSVAWWCGPSPTKALHRADPGLRTPKFSGPTPVPTSPVFRPGVCFSSGVLDSHQVHCTRIAYACVAPLLWAGSGWEIFCVI